MLNTRVCLISFPGLAAWFDKIEDNERRIEETCRARAQNRQAQALLQANQIHAEARALLQANQLRAEENRRAPNAQLQENARLQARLFARVTELRDEEYQIMEDRDEEYQIMEDRPKAFRLKMAELRQRFTELQSVELDIHPLMGASHELRGIDIDVLRTEQSLALSRFDDHVRDARFFLATRSRVRPSSVILTDLAICSSRSDDLCPICLVEVGHGTSKVTRCNHVFHGDCIQKWVSMCPDRRCPSCPVCRQGLKPPSA
jgi:hypothetical protein